MQMFADNMGIRVIRAAAEERFLTALAGEVDPEAKRKIIGREFIAVFAEEARKLDGVKFLAQGTIYPDVIESAASKQGKARSEERRVGKECRAGGAADHEEKEEKDEWSVVEG